MITEEEYNRMIAMHRSISYTSEEITFLLNMTHRFVDEHMKVCPTCNASISALKQKIYGWFLNNKEAIEAELFPKEPKIDDFNKAKEEVKKYTDEK